MKRKIITINEDLCNGCGQCVNACSEGALQIVDGKAKLVKEDFCDGFGDCLGECPTGALIIEEKEVKDFDEKAVKKHLMQTQGKEAVKRMEEAQKKHQGDNKMEKTEKPCCPGSMMREFKKETFVKPSDNNQMGSFVIPSELSQWPVQIHLVNPKAPYFKNKELVVLSTCSPIASADVHWRYIRGRSVVVGCPKLDNTAPYAEKLGEILKEKTIPKIIVTVMEVPCCKGLTMIVKDAVRLSGRNDLVFEEHILSLDGKLKEVIKH